MNIANSTTFQSITLTLLRVVAGLLYMQHGAQKLFGVLGGFGGELGATAPLFSLMRLVGVLEFFGGLAIVVGLLTRPVAFVLAGEMATPISCCNTCHKASGRSSMAVNPPSCIW